MSLKQSKEIVQDFSLDQYIGKNHVLFFFYPKDFTFVCPSELHAFQNALGEFEARGVKVVACSTDTEESHWAWLQTPKNKGGIEGVMYPIVADSSKTISEAYGVLDGEYKSYYKTGKITEILNYKAGKLHGIAKRFADNGVLLDDLNYYNGKQLICKFF